MSSSSGSGAGAGGRMAGNGTAGLGGAATAPLKTSRDETVNAAIGGTGTSEMSTKEPGGRSEGSQRTKRDIAIEFLKIQEEALASEPLPLSRREHVLRYFTALRKQLEQDGK